MEATQATKAVDLKGLSCPMPVVKTKKALDTIDSGQILMVETTDKGSKADISSMLKRTGHELLEVQENNNVFVFFIKKA